MPLSSKVLTKILGARDIWLLLHHLSSVKVCSGVFNFMILLADPLWHLRLLHVNVWMIVEILRETWWCKIDRWELTVAHRTGYLAHWYEVVILVELGLVYCIELMITLFN